MVEIHSKAIDEVISTERIIRQLDHRQPGPTILFFGGLHGNEPSGVFGLHKALDRIESLEIPVQGSIHAIAGNLNALSRGQRYISADLNRVWILNDDSELVPTQQPEADERKEIHSLILDILKKYPPPYYFIDLHTTSSATIPFITINDTMVNRDFANHFPVPIVLGIEEFLDGPLLSYINDLGYLSIGFESGQHDAKQAIDNAESFIYGVLHFANAIAGISQKLEVKKHLNLLKEQTRGRDNFYEITIRHEIRGDHGFKMQEGYSNFERIQKKELLAYAKGKPVHSERKGLIFMPLYQPQGDEGYFIVRRIPGIFLALSRWLRGAKVDGLLILLPGVKWYDEAKTTLIIDNRIARFLRREILHLFGYRSRSITKTFVLAKNRERMSRKREYRD